MAQTFVRIEDIVEALTADLDQRGFSRIEPDTNEVLRYEKRDSSIQFQVGIENDPDEAAEPEFNHFYLILGYSLTKNSTERQGEQLFPNPELLNIFFRCTGIYHHGQCGNEDKFHNGRIKIIYHVGFEKEEVTVLKMQALLREFIDYACNYVSLNTQMLERSISSP